MLTSALTPEDKADLRNLITALEEKLKAYTAYREYAKKADDEGLFGLGSLFRATSRSEQIHANNHARVIRQMGGSALPDIPEPRVESSFENLRTAVIEERFETDYLYPTFLSAAFPLSDFNATRSFHWALEADKSHVRLLNDAVSRLNANVWTGKAYKRHELFVCALCGYTAESRASENCPTCNLIWERFETIQ